MFYDIGHAFAAWFCFYLLFRVVGIKRSLTSSFICTAIFFLMLIIGKSLFNNVFLLIFIGLFGGFGNGLFWTSYHYTFALSGHEHKREKEISQAYLAIQAANTLAPFAGGLAIATLGYNAIFLFAQSLLVLGAITFLTSKDWKEPLPNIKEKGLDDKERIVFFFNGFQNFLLIILWPLFAFIFIFNAIQSLGLLSTFSRFISFTATAAIGKARDEESKNILTKAAILNSGAWIGKAIVLNPISVFLLHSLQNLAQIGIGINLDAISYSRALVRTPALYLIEREMLIHIGSSVAATLFLIFYLILKNIMFPISFFAGAITSFAYSLM